SESLAEVFKHGTTMPLSELLHTSSEDLKSELHLILNAIVEGVCGIDHQGNCTCCNEALLKMIAIAASEIIGQNMHELVHHTKRNGAAYPAQECVFLEAVRTHRAIHIAGEFLWRKDGTCFPAECWCHP